LEAVSVTSPKDIAQRIALRPGGRLNRTICDAKNRDTLPGDIVRTENGKATRDAAVEEAYDGLGLAYNFFWDVFGRDSIDGKGMTLEATVHYSRAVANAFWTGKHMAFGDGDGVYFNRFTIAPDIAAKEFAMGMIQADTNLEYWEQSGAIFQSFALVFASLAKQYALGQTADNANWLVGEGLLKKKVKGKALISLSDPGTAYDDPGLGKDPQPAHMRDYVTTTDDNGGIHTNSGILNRAFYLTAMALGGYAWEKAGRIWYESLRDKQLKPKSQFNDLAYITLANARRLYGRASDEAQAVKNNWEMVGIKPAKP
jgi:Zn-dependent metalloprotease